MRVTKRKGVRAMKYQIQYNNCRKEWWIFCVGTHGATLVKTFKTERGAKMWVVKMTH